MLTITKKILWNVFAHIYVTVNPMFWFQNQKTSKLTDTIINDLIDNNAPISDVRECVVKLGDRYVWIANYPYSYGNINDGKFASELLPRKVTRLRLKMYFDKHNNQRMKSEESALLNEYFKDKNK